jgi:hypothetical protein
MAPFRVGGKQLIFRTLTIPLPLEQGKTNDFLKHSPSENQMTPFRAGEKQMIS